jgi:hypothetical protein
MAVLTAARAVMSMTSPSASARSADMSTRSVASRRRRRTARVRVNRSVVSAGWRSSSENGTDSDGTPVIHQHYFRSQGPASTGSQESDRSTSFEPEQMFAPTRSQFQKGTVSFRTRLHGFPYPSALAGVVPVRNGVTLR